MKLIINLNTNDKSYEETLLKHQNVDYKPCQVALNFKDSLRSYWMIDCNKIDTFNDIYKLCVCYDVDTFLKLENDKCFQISFNENGFYTEKELSSYYIKELA